jgi:hypothetical protein
MEVEQTTCGSLPASQLGETTSPSSSAQAVAKKLPISPQEFSSEKVHQIRLASLEIGETTSPYTAKFSSSTSR